MIVKILKKSMTFKAVNYNTGKVDKNKGELLLVKNFGVLHAIENLRPQDYINYLEAVSARSTRIRYPQFHVAISTKGRQHSKEELTEIAEKWMTGMGYGEQPYLLIFHSDTHNNHVHLVSTRVGKDGKKIADRYEKLRAYRILNQILGEDEKHLLDNHLQKALSYHFSTRAQFTMLLENQGYTLSLKDGEYKICKYGRQLGFIDLKSIDLRIADRQKDVKRIKQIVAITERYRSHHDASIVFSDNGYRSALTEFLHTRFGLQIVFHGNDRKPPYGYTLFDHHHAAVYKGSEIMSLRQLISSCSAENQSDQDKPEIEITQVENLIGNLSAKIIGNINPDKRSPDPCPHSAPVDNSVKTSPEDSTKILLPTLDIDIANDIDDEAILGRNRRRKRKSRTNTR